MNYTFNNCKLNSYGETIHNSWYRWKNNKIDTPRDSSNNILNINDQVLIIPHGRWSYPYITTIIEIHVDQTNEIILGIKFLNGQYSTLNNLYCFKVTKDFLSLHSNLVAK